MSYLSSKEDNIFQGSLIQAELNAIRECEIEDYYLAVKHCNIKNTHQQVQVRGILTVRDANKKITQYKLIIID
ncbi:hypothetical protein I7I51_02515 [Histoplasma capsulatum]|uniref:Uncharacterized protein n=1 Tax=Ajellomyces capsulatus TaxID=5037 RepID=A0A8A1MAG6_AJECA|nr:hypothetical protein I7I51_02515 [Histoplasma capsulatum]